MNPQNKQLLATLEKMAVAIEETEKAIRQEFSVSLAAITEKGEEKEL